MAQENLELVEDTFDDESVGLEASELSMFDATSEPGAAAPTGEPTLNANQPSAPAPVPTTVPTPAVPQATPAQAVAPPAEPVVGQPPATPSELPAAAPSAPAAAVAPTHAQIRANALSQLEKEFTVSEEDSMELLAGNFNKVFPRAMANLSIITYEHTMAALLNIIPELVRNVTAQDTTTNREWNSFFTEYPQLATKQSEVYQLAAQYRQMNPQMPADQFKREIAALAGARLGIAFSRTEAPVQTTPTRSPVVPQPPMRPYTPAAPGAIGAPPAASNGNFYESLFDEFRQLED